LQDCGALMTDSGERTIGLALSGGGFRATLFHLGVVRLLYETKLLARVKFIGAVSGGSILAAHLALRWDEYIGTEESFTKAANDLISFIQSDVRGRIIRRSILGWIILIPRFLLPRSLRWTFGNLLQSQYKRLYKTSSLTRVQLQHLRGENRPLIFFNCTSLTTGSACYFGPDGFTWYEKGEQRTVKSDETPVAFSVAASSAFPPLFPPIEISADTLVCSHRDFDKPHCLTDGGVYDNLGVNRLLERMGETSLLLVSDAEGDFDSEFEKHFTSLISRNIRASDLLMTRVSALQLEALVAQEASFARIGIKDVIGENEFGAPPERRLTFEQQRAASKIRTDLDEFSSDEAYALLTHGYNIARRCLINANLLRHDKSLEGWKRLTAYKTEGSLTTTLRESANRKWRIASPMDWASWATAAIILVAAYTGVTFGKWEYDRYRQNIKSAGASTSSEAAAVTITNLTKELADLRATLDKQNQPTTQTKTISLQICQGQFSDQCPANSVWLGCGADIANFISSQCASSTSTRISSRGGNQCGYSVDQVLCVQKPPATPVGSTH
jgi:predicted acylesterase/phospholipase RssA